MKHEEEVEYIWTKGLDEMLHLDAMKRHLLKNGSIIKHKTKRIWAIDAGFGISFKKKKDDKSWQCSMVNLERFLYETKTLPTDWKLICEKDMK